ncbi:MAG TPA: nucleotide excision repair endonuclease [Candidatus Polarisedimenticolaceae bacterium]|nr:nucleotide excision repair endonuclease [Candidatus Polarisedimenticolaceae bacterium]
MSRPRRTVSLVAERALRYLRASDGPATSVELAGEVLATRAVDESTAKRVLDAAFAGDPRLVYRRGRWSAESRPAPRPARRPAGERPDEPDRVLLIVEGELSRTNPRFALRAVSAVRMRDELVVGACGGHATDRGSSEQLRRSVLETIEGAIPVVHDPPGALDALERWLGEPLPAVVSLRELARRRLGLRKHADLETLVARLGLVWYGRNEPVDLAETLEECLARLRRPDEDLRQIQRELSGEVGRLDWSRFAFDRAFIDAVPAVPGTYRFYDRRDELLYVGKSRNLARRLTSYFRDGERVVRNRKLLAELYRIEYEPAGSELEAVLREAEQIRDDQPKSNVQREVRERHGRAARLRSILILEPAESPNVLRAFLIRDARLVGRVGIGPRGGGLKRIERILEDYFFSAPAGPTVVAGPDLDVEIVARWLAGNRDRAVAFDPTDLRTSGEVIERLQWFLGQARPFDTDGTPFRPR